MDDDHKRLIDLINRLAKAMESGDSKAVATQVLDELVDYTRTHFTREEKLMSAHGYGDLPHQLDEHKKLVGQLVDIQTQFDAGTITLAGEVMRFLKRWLRNHILGSDMQYKKFFNAKGVH